MEPFRLRAILARTPGLLARHLFACLTDSHVSDAHGPHGPLPLDLLARLLHGPLPPRARAWLEQPDSRLIDSDMRWIERNDCLILSCLDP